MALLDFMRKQQFDLPTSEAQQTIHAWSGGYCSLHTWEYAEIASPVGICSGYAAVLDAIGGRLHALSAHSSSTGSLADAVKEVLQMSERCRACQVIAATERAAASEIVNDLSGKERLPALCIPHLYTVLAAKPEMEIARLLVEDLSEVLRRIAENMRLCALKHDAIRRELASTEEHDAYLTGLLRLAGDRRLAHPWVTFR